MSLFSKLILSKEFIKLKVLMTLMYIALELYYFKIISPEYNHLGYNLDFNLLKYIITKIYFVVLMGLSLFLYDKSKFLYSIYLILIFFFFIPNAILFSFGNMAYPPFICNAFFVSFFITSPYFKVKIPVIQLNDKWKPFLIVLLTMVLIIPIVVVFKSEIYLSTLLLKNIYETRELFSEKMGGVISYLYHISVKTVLPIALIFFMIKKKPVFIGLFFIILLYLFVISGNKFVYFTSIILIFFYYIGKDYTSKITFFFTLLLLLFILFPLIDYNLLDNEKPVLIGTFVNRFLFTPSILTQWYFEFFNGKPFYFAESHFFNKFVQSPYDMPVGFLISKTYLNEPTVYANNGIVSDGFMNLGYWGVLLFSFIFSALFGLFNSFQLHKGYFGLYFAYIFMFLSAQFLSCFITGGILLFLFLAIFVLRDNKLIQNKL